MKLRHVLISAALLLAIAVLAQPVSAFEDEDRAPGAFVEGTRDYSIPYMEKTLAKLRKHFSESELRPFGLAIAGVKAQNTLLIERIKRLRAQKNLLKEKDAELVLYRETMAKATNVMFALLQKLNERTALPSR